MQLITEEYKRLNQELHDTNKHYGTSGRKYTKDIMKLVMQLNTQDILDYGCGKCTLQQNLPFKIKQYDPCVPKYAATPFPADIVVCTDVLEHIEPELIENVLTHIQSLTKKAAYLTVSTVPAQKKLSDGRNAHILLRTPEWWSAKMFHYFEPITYMNNGGNIIFLVKAKGVDLNEQKTQEQAQKAEVQNGQVDERPKDNIQPNSKQPSTSDFFVGI